jgi:hypothetical protein
MSRCVVAGLLLTSYLFNACSDIGAGTSEGDGQASFETVLEYPGRAAHGQTVEAVIGSLLGPGGNLPITSASILLEQAGFPVGWFNQQAHAMLYDLTDAADSSVSAGPGVGELLVCVGEVCHSVVLFGDRNLAVDGVSIHDLKVSAPSGVGVGGWCSGEVAVISGYAPSSQDLDLPGRLSSKSVEQFGGQVAFSMEIDLASFADAARPEWTLSCSGASQQ